MEGLTILTNIALIFLIGLLTTLISKKLEISNVLLLVLAGIGLQFLEVGGERIFQFTPTFLVSVSILAIVMIVFDSTSRFRWKEMDEISVTSLKLTGWFTLANLVVFSLVAMLIVFGEFSLKNYLYGMIFSAAMIATDPSTLFVMMGDVKHRIINLMELESIINTPLTVLLPFVILDLIETIGETNILSSFLQQIVPFVQQIVVGIGAGVVIGVIVFKVMKNFYSEQLSPVGIVTAALLAYILAANMGGSGVLSVATLGLFFGSVYVKQKTTLKEFSSMLSNSLEILVFVLVGLMIQIPLEVSFYLESILLFLILLACRSFAVFYALREEPYTFPEKLFATLNIPKGIAMAVVAFSFTVRDIPALAQMLDYMLAIMVISLIVSTIVVSFSEEFINIDIQKPEETKPNPNS